MNNMPKYVLKNKRLSKTKTVTIFRRNYLDVNKFKKENGGWVYEEEFVHYGTKCKFKLVIHSDDICNMYEVNCKSLKIKGPRNGFGIFIRLPKQKLPFKAHGERQCVEYYLECVGKTLAYDNGKGIGKTKEGKMVATIHQETKTAISVPNSVSWSASHPFQGGGVSPR